MELQSKNYTKALDIFQDCKNHLCIHGVIHGLIPSRIFMADDSATAMVASTEGIYLGGNPDNDLFLREMNSLLRHEIFPKLDADDVLDYVVYYPQSPLWEAKMDIVMKDLYAMKSGRMTFSHDLGNTDAPLADGVIPVDQKLLAREDCIGVDDVLEEISNQWPSLEAFLDKGFGCVGIEETERGPVIVSWCLTDWVVGSECELGVETAEGYREKGWAKKTAAGALVLARKRGLTRAGWQCWSSNAASRRTALSVGFKPLAEYPVLFGWTNPLNNFLVNGNYYMQGDGTVGTQKDYARAAWSYAQALDKGWDWDGMASLYWNAACLFYRIGEKERAKHYYRIAVEKGWDGTECQTAADYVYSEADSAAIALELAK
ncbi:GNAT family N-acetyltransferase [Brevibacillus borstelensis]|uniref:GNAT family N-acetyltransferase n=1 Tax=Brevibacillus borstelensis TaxID=45462 RepID=UPI003CF5D077